MQFVNITGGMMVPMRWLRLLSAWGATVPWSLALWGTGTFSISLDFIAFSVLPSPTTVGAGRVGVCMCIGVCLLHFLIPHTL